MFQKTGKNLLTKMALFVYNFVFASNFIKQQYKIFFTEAPECHVEK